MSNSIVRNITSQSTKSAALAQVQALIAGTNKTFPNAALTFGNATVQASSIVQDLQNLEQAMLALTAAQSNARDAVSALRTLEVSVGPLVRAYKRFLLATYGTSAQQLAVFGLQPPKARTPISTGTRATATAKARATRAARGTKGKKQKLAIKGDVTGVVVTPITNPPEPKPEPSPSPSASPAAHAPAPAAER
ncbi:MAG TPA: hypothetical protein VK841_15405 [Polyangiaceae bacterium]|jgi:hypothetical protein|nr:hypothetical protein [Polyangiaceae bacterium]